MVTAIGSALFLGLHSNLLHINKVYGWVYFTHSVQFEAESKEILCTYSPEEGEMDYEEGESGKDEEGGGGWYGGRCGDEVGAG